METLKKIFIALIMAVSGAAIIITLQAKFYHQPTPEDAELFQLYVDSEFFAIISEVERTDKEHLNPLKAGFGERALRIRYIDLRTQSHDYFITDMNFQSSIAIGDTISKSRGDTTFCLRKIKPLRDGRKFVCSNNFFITNE